MIPAPILNWAILLPQSTTAQTMLPSGSRYQTCIHRGSRPVCVLVSSHEEVGGNRKNLVLLKLKDPN